MKSLALALTTIAALGLAADKFIPNDDIAARRHDMLNPTVRIQSPFGFGSGTIVHSDATGTYILTNHHVIAAEHREGPEATAHAPHGHQVPLPPHRPDIPPQEIHFRVAAWPFLHNERVATPVGLRATLVADDADDDLALLKVTDPTFRAANLPRFAGSDDEPQMAEDAYAVGGGIAERPFITQGLISLVDISDQGPGEDGKDLISAPIIGGNSGGGAYVQRGHRFVFFGVPEAIEIASGAGVPHMGLVIPMRVVRPFLASAGLVEFEPHHRTQEAAR